jgi:hypothetical protein
MSQDEATLSSSDGWGWPGLSRKAHYFVGSRSLCGRWMYTGRRLAGPEAKPSPDDCKECGRRLAKTRGEKP